MPRVIGLVRLLFLAGLIFPCFPSSPFSTQIALLVIAALTLVPLEIVRKWVRAIQYALRIGEIGDSDPFVESAANRAAILGRVRKRLEDLVGCPDAGLSSSLRIHRALTSHWRRSASRSPCSSCAC